VNISEWVTEASVFMQSEWGFILVNTLILAIVGYREIKRL
jgi:hypothetical protein